MIKSVKIGPQKFSVIERNPKEDGMLNEGAYGYTLDNSNTIVISADASNGKKQVTMLHEILHAIRMSYDGMPKPSKDDDFETWEHFFIAMYESGMLAVLKDNPKLVEWLLKDDSTNK